MKRRHGRRGKARSVDQGASSRRDDPSIPRSMVIAKSDLRGSGRTLLQQLRQMMLPYTASKLRQSKHNVLRDFITVASTLHVSHLILLKQTSTGATSLYIGQTPTGPTLVFDVLRYSLCQDVSRVKKVRKDFTEPPVVVLNGLKRMFENASELEKKSASIVTNMLSRLFPAVDPQQMTAESCRRLVLFSKSKLESAIELRHYSVVRKPVGVSSKVQKLLSKINAASKLDFSRVESVSDIIHDDGSMSDAAVEEQVSTAAPVSQGGSKQLAIGVQEIGPRLTLRLRKVHATLDLRDDNQDALVELPEEGVIAAATAAAPHAVAD